jgi:phosphohistidine swiveling domain-containing protein
LDIPDDDIVYFGQRVEPFFASSVVAGGLCDADNLKRRFGLDHPVGWFQHVADSGRHVYDFFNVKSELESFQSETRKKIEHTSAKYVGTLVKACEAAGEALVGSAERHTQAFDQSITDEALADLIASFTLQAREYCVYYTLAFYEKPTMDIVRDIIGKHAEADEESDDLFEICTTASGKTDTDREQEAFLELAGKAWSDADARKEAARAHAKRYGWLGVRFFLGEWWSGDDVLSRMSEISREKAAGLLFEEKNRLAVSEERIMAFKNRMTEHEVSLLNQVRDIIYLRTQRADYFNHAGALVQPMIKEAANRLHVSYHDVMYFAPEEVARAIRGEYDIHDDLESRRKDMLMYLGNGSICAVSGDEAAEYAKSRPIFRRDAERVDSLKGSIAYKGKVTGAVRVVFTQEDSYAVLPGDILVTTMTTPNLIGAMEKAAAFVTDEGGITCHAAIVARELKKPCIVGTKIATRVLHDGDLVEVDADSGVVRVIKRSNT